MSSEKIPILSEFRRKKAAMLPDEYSVENGGGGGDNGGMDDLTRRVGTLETKMDKVQDTLNAMQVTLAEIKASMATKDDISPIRADVSAIKATLEGKASSSSVAELKGRIDSLPGIAKISAVVALIGAALKLGPMIFGH